MQFRRTLISATLAFALSTTALAQHDHDGMKMGDMKMGDMKPHNMSAMMGTPAFDKSVDGLHIQVWIITQEAHKKIMNEQMKDMMHGKEEGEDMHSMDHKSMDAMMSGTHHIMVSLTDEKMKMPADSAKVEVRIDAPSKTSSTTALSQMKGHFGGGISLNEKGEYLVGLTIALGGKLIDQEFTYKVTD